MDGIGSLEDVRLAFWQKLERAAAVASDPWHLPVLGTVDDGAPRLRTVVLRGFDPTTGRLWCHTDTRSPKVEQLGRSSQVSWLFYDREEKLQLRVRGTARVVTEGDLFEKAWAASEPRSRKCYLGPHAPSSLVAEPDPNLPEEFLGRDPTVEQTEPGRDRFAVIDCTPDAFDWLRLRHDGHTRAAFERDGDDWTGNWVAP